ncbi:unnamed protein product [Musa acuminata subsp. malaccensis]|uniref:(wild Malaysian banana) hypothetical protein n=1 Tax=Musa acuminata subsp. malaccensis TaxID=214687 RepID=A0A8D7AS48_MUSAM|nr:unnamed protein product [Musa acuminata subsp. malaccensis]
MSNVVDLKCSGNAVYFFLHHALSVGSRYGMLDSLERYEIMSSGALVPSLFKRCSILSTLSGWSVYLCKFRYIINNA